MFLVDLVGLRWVTLRLPDHDAIRWHVCSNCLWLSPGLYPGLLGDVSSGRCTRPDDQPYSYGWGASAQHWRCADDNELVVLDEQLTATIHAALLVGGNNAVLEIIQAMKPEDMGLLSHLAKYHQRKSNAEMDRWRA